MQSQFFQANFSQENLFDFQETKSLHVIFQNPDVNEKVKTLKKNQNRGRKIFKNFTFREISEAVVQRCS